VLASETAAKQATERLRCSPESSCRPSSGSFGRHDPTRAFDRLPDGGKRQHVREIETAKKPETRIRRIEKALTTLRGSA